MLPLCYAAPHVRPHLYKFWRIGPTAEVIYCVIQRHLPSTKEKINRILASSFLTSSLFEASRGRGEHTWAIFKAGLDSITWTSLILLSDQPTIKISLIVWSVSSRFSESRWYPFITDQDDCNVSIKPARLLVDEQWFLIFLYHLDFWFPQVKSHFYLVEQNLSFNKFVVFLKL